MLGHLASVLLHHHLPWLCFACLHAGEKWYNEKFMKWFGPVALISLLYTIIVLFALQGHQVRE